MSPKEGFGVLVRVLGLGLVLHGAARALAAIMMNVWSLEGLWLHAILTIGLGLWMLRGAKALVDWAYKE